MVKGPPRTELFSGMQVVVDNYCPPNTCYVINPDYVIMATPMRPRTWWKPWTWKRRPLTMSEMFKGL